MRKGLKAAVQLQMRPVLISSILKGEKKSDGRGGRAFRGGMREGFLLLTSR